METMQQIKDSWQEFGDESNEETLSLCDFVMNDDDFSKHDQHNYNNNTNNNNGDMFEFFNEDFPASPSVFPENNIFFCGKTISYRENKSQSPKCKNKQESKEKMKKLSSRNSCLFPWKISSSPPHPFNKSRTLPSSPKPTKESQRKSFNKSYSMPTSVSKNKYEKFGVENNKLNDEKFDFSVKKVSKLASPVKSRWYLFAFGVGRFPMDIELKDMRMRQTRKLKSTKCQTPGSGRGDGGDISENVNFDNGKISDKVCRGCLMFLG